MPVGARRAAGCSHRRPDGRHESPEFQPRRHVPHEHVFRHRHEPLLLADADVDDPGGFLEPDVHGAVIPGGHAAERPTRRRQTLFHELVHDVGDPFPWRGCPIAHCHAEPGTGDYHQPELPSALSNRRNRLRAAAGGRAASARFHNEPERAVRPSSGPRYHAATLLRAGGRPRPGTGGVPAPRVCRGTPAGPARPPLAGFHAHRR